MDPNGHQLYQHPSMGMMGQSGIGTVPGSIPLNYPLNIPAQRNMGVQGAPMLENQASFTQKPDLNKITAQQEHLSTDEDYSNPRHFLDEEENDVADLSTKENDAAELSTEENDFDEKDDISIFMESAHDIFLKVCRQELKIQEAADILGRPYAYVYSRYQEFCDDITGKITAKVKKKKRSKEKERSKDKERSKEKENGKKRRKPKKLTIIKRERKSQDKPVKSGKVLQCPECPATFTTNYLMKTHSKTHLGITESHLCTSCGIVFSRLGQLMKHRINEHDDALQCQHCEKKFTSIKSYQSHVTSHTKDSERPFICEECGKGYFSRVSLEEHYRKHTGFKPFMCGHCEKTFKSLRVLTDHQQKHTEEGMKPKICGYCGKGFKSIKALSIHARIHTKPREKQNFDCQKCGKHYNRGYKLEVHMRTHTGEKPFVCEFCNARFSEKANLKRHKMVHTGELPFKCKYCSAAFLTKMELARHNMAHAGIKPFKCSLCEYSCVKKPSMVYHMNVHLGKTPFKCDFYGCSAEFASPSLFRSHKLKHFPPVRRCKFCNEEFPDANSLKHHLLLHTSSKPLSCNQCDKIFYNQSSLNRHVNVHMNKPEGHKPKPARQRKKNPNPVKRAEKSVPALAVAPHPAIPQISQISQITQKKFTSEYEAPNQYWTIGAQGINSHQSIPAHFLLNGFSNVK